MFSEQSKGRINRDGRRVFPVRLFHYFFHHFSYSPTQGSEFDLKQGKVAVRREGLACRAE